MSVLPEGDVHTLRAGSTPVGLIVMTRGLALGERQKLIDKAMGCPRPDTASGE
jgi:hypothetical protein